jgi:hypothetical protein
VKFRFWSLPFTREEGLYIDTKKSLGFLAANSLQEKIICVCLFAARFGKNV